MNPEIEQLKLKYIGQLKELKDDYSDDIPEEKVGSDISERGMEFKVQVGWWRAVEAVMHNIQSNGLMSPELIRKADEFRDKFFHGKNGYIPLGIRRTREVEIEEANYLIDEVLEYLEGKKLDN